MTQSRQFQHRSGAPRNSRFSSRFKIAFAGLAFLWLPVAKASSLGGTNSGRAVANQNLYQRAEDIPLLKKGFVRRTGDFLEFDLLPSASKTYDNVLYNINQWGMRDREYSIKRPRKTYRIALLGSSVEMASGVRMEDGYESLVESRLNHDGPGAGVRKYEILNFAVGSYSILQNVVVAEKKVMGFSPQAIILTIHSIEPRPTLRLLMTMTTSKTPIPYPFINDVLRRAGVNSEMLEPELIRRLSPHMDEVLQWGYERIAEVGREKGIPVIAVVVPRADLPSDETPLLRKQAKMAAAAGMSVITLEGAFEGQPPAAIRLPPPDAHPSPRGHQLLADKFYDQLRLNDATTLRLGFPK